MRRVASLFALCCGLVLSPLPVAAEEGARGAGRIEAKSPAAGSFVRARGDRFEVEGRPFSFLGANVDAVQGEAQRARYRHTLRALVDDGLRVARVWAFAEGPADAGEWWRRDHLFRAGPEGWVEPAYRHLDAVIAEAGRLGLRLVLTLGNNWGDYGGIPMYLRWAGLPAGEGAHDPARDAFYRDERVRAFFRQGVERLLLRVNSVTGVRYADDPTILSWELLNESTVATAEGAAARRAWIAEMAGFIKQHDPHHLVAPGVVGYASRAERADWIAVHRLAAIDYCDSHLYVEHEPRLAGLRALRAAIDDRAQLCRFVVGKPLVIGEFGFRTDRGGDPEALGGAPPQAWFRRLLSRALADGAAGALAWIYQPWSGAPRDFGIYTDRPDTDEVRAVMRALSPRFAAAPAANNPRLGPAVGERLLWDPRLGLVQPLAPAHRWRADGDEQVLELPVSRFREARFEREGQAPGARLCGVGFGKLLYRFRSPATTAAPERVTIAARLSSHGEGVGPAAPGGSTVVLAIDEQAVARLEVPPPAAGARSVQVVVRSRAVRERLAAPGPHRLSFELADAASSRGLCLYDPPIAIRYRLPPPTASGGP